MFFFEKKIFTYKLNEKNVFFPQIPSVKVHKNKIFIFISYREKKDVKKLKPTAKIGLVTLNEKFKVINKFKKIKVKKNSLYFQYAQDGIMPSHIIDNNEIYLTGWKRTKKYPHRTFSLRGSFRQNTISLNKVFFKNKMLTNAPYIFKEKKKKYFFLGIFTKWVKHRSKLESCYTLYLDYKNKLKKIYKDDTVKNRPCVIKIQSKYFLFFCRRKSTNFRNNTKNSYKIYYSNSSNLLKWSKLRKLTFPKKFIKSWNNQMQCYPQLFYFKKNLYLVYCGNNFGKDGFEIVKIKYGN